MQVKISPVGVFLNKNITSFTEDITKSYIDKSFSVNKNKQTNKQTNKQSKTKQNKTKQKRQHKKKTYLILASE